MLLGAIPTLLMMSLTIQLFISNAYGAEEIILYPNALQKVHLGMSYSELKKLFPKAQDLAGTPDQDVVTVDFIQNDQLWDSVMYDFKTGKLVSISLLSGAVKSDGVKDVIPQVLREVLKKYGKDFQKRINLESKNELQPLFVWTKKEHIVTLSYTPERNIKKTKRPQVVFRISAPERKLSELFQVPPPEVIEAALFDLLISESDREVLVK